MALIFIPHLNTIEVLDGRDLLYRVYRDDRGWWYTNQTVNPPRKSQRLSFMSADLALRRLVVGEDRTRLALVGQTIDLAWPEEPRFTDIGDVGKDSYWVHRFSTKLNSLRNWPCMNPAVIWCRDQFGRPGYSWTQDNQRWICFHGNEQAMAFKMRWC